ncbi:MAG: RsmE family RNA methyltransferase [Bacillota bacterium]|nr:RsmE family RNA methyltransferase [Bacillota bacterium]
MSLPRFFLESISEDIEPGAVLSLSSGDSHHARRVLRLLPGAAVVLCDGRCRDLVGRLLADQDPDTGAARVVIDTVVPSPAERGPYLILWQGLPKQAKLEEIITRAVELGVHEIRPLLCRRSVSRPDSRSAASRLERWRQLAEAAAKQAGRGLIPEVRALTPLNRALDDYTAAAKAAAEPERRLGLLPWEGEEAVVLPQPLGRHRPGDLHRIDVLIGPEGGFDPEEVDRARAAGFISVSLGPRILRTETAGPAVLAMLLAWQLAADRPSDPARNPIAQAAKFLTGGDEP